MTIKELMIKGGIREGFREGTSKMALRPCYGYVKEQDGTLSINDQESKIVRWIFERYLAGDSLGKIAQGLAEQNIPSPSGKENWNRQAIDKLLSNEKYIGQAMLQKTFTQDGKQVKNMGQQSKYVYEGNNPEIIAGELFAAVQQERERRSRHTHSIREPKPEQTLQML